jgi:transposase
VATSSYEATLRSRAAAVRPSGAADVSHPRHLRPAPRRVRPIRARPATIVQDIRSSKIRSFTPLPDDVSLEELVPEDHLYRRREATLDLSFVRELVAPLYAKGGRPSVDPVVFFKLQLVMFFEDLRSERQLMRVVADRLSLRWYLGYDLFEPLPDHSSLTRIRERFGLEVFRSFFERIVEECVEAGLV